MTNEKGCLKSTPVLDLNLFSDVPFYDPISLGCGSAEDSPVIFSSKDFSFLLNSVHLLITCTFFVEVFFKGRSQKEGLPKFGLNFFSRL